MTVPREILELTGRFDCNREAYRSGTYNETQLRREFIDPFFKILGWDVDNEKGYAEAYKDVIHEDSIKVGGMTKAPDYCFRIGGVRKFFVETKKPAVNLKDDVDPAFQLRRYAWSARLPLSILTDFEEFVVYDCRVKPDKTDKPSIARILYLNYTEYSQRWDEIASTFSRDAVLKGTFDKYAESSKAKKGTAEVDTAFLKEIESWRDMLARNLALRNPDLAQHDLNFAVQRTIDRIIFLRICEDRGIERYGRLMALQNGDRVYARLCEIFHRADERYNSGLFHFQKEKGRSESPDTLTPNLTIDDSALKDIIKNLYYPDSPYEFSVLSADILGQVYEQFLGKVIRLTAGHRAVVEDKPEVKKAGGVYYTPTYIVDYIVKNTVGRLVNFGLPDADLPTPKSPPGRGLFDSPLERGLGGVFKNPKQVSKLKILDPACGSGSFLLGAYKYLLDWHRDWYVADGPEKWSTGRSPTLYQGMGGDWRLTTAERKRILLNNIYGVDIDPQAVEVTKLSLLLKVLEGESEQTIVKQLKLFHERALPDLGNNIKCGNSLIGTDFYNTPLTPLFRGETIDSPLARGAWGVSDEERYRINPFDWGTEFPEIMKNGGFDVVIGNPPYVRQESLGDEFKKYAAEHYKTYSGMADLYVYFFERSHQLLRVNGLFGMICSNKFMRSNYGKPLRNFLTNETSILQIVDFGELPVFERSSTFPAIYLTSNLKVKNQKCIYGAIKRLNFQSLEKEMDAIGIQLDNRSLTDDNWTLTSNSEINLIKKIKSGSISLGEYVKGKIYYGIKTGLNEAFVIDEETKIQLIKDDPKSKDIIKPFVVGDDIRKYRIDFKNKYLIFIPKGWTNKNVDDKRKAWNWFKKAYPAISTHLEPFAEKAEKRCDKGDYWWELRACDYYEKFDKPKIMYPDIAKESRLYFDTTGLYCANTVYFIPTNDLYLLGVLNSRLIFKYYKRSASVLGDADKGGRVRWFTQDVLKLPIRTINFSDPKDKFRHDRMVALVNQMLLLHKQIASAKTDHDKTTIHRQIDATDRQIDQLVYELYGLTTEEIRIVEEGLS